MDQLDTGTPNTQAELKTYTLELESQIQKLQAELNETKKEAQLLVQHAPSAIYEIDLQRICFANVNDLMCQISGFSREELLGMNPFDLLEEPGKALLKERMQKTLAGEPIDPCVEYNFQTKDGRALFVELNTTIQVRDGKAHTAFVIAHDVTERRRIEKALLAHQERNQEILNSISDGLLGLDREWRFTFINEKAAANIGFKPEELINKNIWEAFPSILGTDHERYYRLVMESRQMADFEIHGVLTKHSYAIRVYPSNEGITVYWVDITERIQTEEALREAHFTLQEQAEELEVQTEELKQQTEELMASNQKLAESEQKYALLFGKSTVASALTKLPEKTFADVNEAFEKLFGYSRQELIGKTSLEAGIAKPDEHAVTVAEVKKHGQQHDAEKHFRTKSGREIIALVNADSLELNGEQYTITTIQDITERKRAELLVERDLDAMRRLQKIGTLFVQKGNMSQVLTEIVEAAIAITGADFGNIQLLDPISGDLRIAAYRGFPQWWLDFWESVSRGKGSCGTALERGERVIVEDVEKSPIFVGTPALEIQLRAGIRAVQSTPLISRSGIPVGMFSTQYRTPRQPDEHALRLLDLLARQAADIIEQKAAEERLEVQADLIENVHDAIIATDKEMRVTYWNQAAEQLYGWRRAEALGQNAAQLLRSELAGAERAEVLNLGAQTGSFHGEIIHYAKDGRRLVIESQTKFRKDASGEVVSYLSANRDVTVRKQMEQALQESEKRERQRASELAAIMDAVPAMIWISHDPQCLEMTGNRFGFEFLRMGQEDNISKTAPSVELTNQPYKNYKDGKEIPPEELPMQIAASKGISTKNYDFDLVFSDGVIKTVLGDVVPLFDEQGRPSGAIAAFVDITERKRMDEALRQSEEKFARAFQSNAAGLTLTRIADGLYVDVNPSLCQLIGYEREEIVGHSPIELGLFSKSTREALWKQFFEQGFVHQQEFSVKAKDGSQKFVLFSIDPIEVAGEPHILASLIDITGRKQAEKQLQETNTLLEQRVQERTAELETSLQKEKSMRQQLIQAEKFAALSRLLASVAHEINNPLQSVINSLYLLTPDLPEGESQEILKMALHESQRIGALVHQLHETYQPSSPQRVNFNLVEVQQKVFALLGPQLKQNNVQWQFHTEKDPVICYGIPDQIRQVCLNICLNAVDAMGARGGCLDVELSQLEPEKVCISFQDSGPGIPEDKLAQVFEPFFTTKEKGLGLGLAICQEIVKGHNGEICVESEPGKGTTFKVWLPSGLTG